MLKLGETGELSPNASAMLRISTVSAWAELELASVRQEYLKKVIDPYRSTLATLWIASLRDYASIRTDSEFLHDSSSVALDSTYSSLGKEVLLPVSTCCHSFNRFSAQISSVLRQVVGDHPAGRSFGHANARQIHPLRYTRSRGWGPSRSEQQLRACGILLRDIWPRL